VDLVIAATGRGSYVITRQSFARPPAAPLLIVDIAVPRDVEPAVAELGNITTYELADLQSVIERTLQERQSEIPAVEAIVAESKVEYLRWYESRAIVPLIARLRSHAEAIRATEIERLFTSLPDLDDKQRAIIEAASVSIINRLLHEPLTRLREAAPHDASVKDLVDLTGLGKQLEYQLSATLKGRNP
jgi:glutamyl-tRNA reductase